MNSTNNIQWIIHPDIDFEIVSSEEVVVSLKTFQISITGTHQFSDLLKYLLKNGPLSDSFLDKLLEENLKSTLGKV